MDDREDFASELEMDLDFGAFDLGEHPLVDRARELTLQLFEAKRDNQWVPEGAAEDHPAAYLVESVAKAGAKIAGSLDMQDWPPDLDWCGMIIARLKRARVYLDDAITALESCQEQKLIGLEIMGVVIVEIVDIAKEADDIIAELRAPEGGAMRGRFPHALLNVKDQSWSVLNAASSGPIRGVSIWGDRNAKLPRKGAGSAGLTLLW